MLHKLYIATFLIMVVISYDVPIAETENVGLFQEVQNLKEQISTLSAENKRLRDAVDQLNVQVKDLYFMTEPLRIRVADKDGGNFYHARSHIKARGKKMWGMLPSQLEFANLLYRLRYAPDFGYSKEQIKEMGDKLMLMPNNSYLNPYNPEYNFHENSLEHDVDADMYLLRIPFFE